MSEILDLLNCRVLTTSHRGEALLILEEPVSQVDRLLSNLVMPEIGGMELLRGLRNKISK